MSEIQTTDWSSTAANNNQNAPAGFPEQMPPSGVNDAARETMAALKKWFTRTHGLTDAGVLVPGVLGSTVTVSVSYDVAPASLFTGFEFSFKAGADCPANALIAINGLGNKNLQKITPAGYVNVEANDYLATQHVKGKYDGALDKCILLSPTPSAASFSLAQLRGHLAGLTLSNNGSDATNDIDIAVGSAIADDQTGALVLASALTKRLDAAWAVGTNQGGLDTGSIANTTYHVWLIRRPDTGVVDVLFSTSASSPTMPSNYTQKRIIGSIIRSGGAIVVFTQQGDEFLLNTPVNDVVSVSNPGTSAVLRTLSIPTGRKLRAIITAQCLNSAGSASTALYVSSPDTTDVAANPGGPFTCRTVNGTVGADCAQLQCRTNTSAQIRSRFSASDANTFISITTHGWIDRRGRDD